MSQREHKKILLVTSQCEKYRCLRTPPMPYNRRRSSPYFRVVFNTSRTQSAPIIHRVVAPVDHLHDIIPPSL